LRATLTLRAGQFVLLDRGSGGNAQVRGEAAETRGASGCQPDMSLTLSRIHKSFSACMSTRINP